MSITEILLILLSIFLFILTLALIIYNTLLKNNLIKPANCPTVAGPFGVLTNKKATILNTCGPDSKQPCIFTNIKDLNSAIVKCDSLLCQAFNYSEKTLTFNIVDKNNIINGTDNIYVKQL
jgi:hypothetical protein